MDLGGSKCICCNFKIRPPFKLCCKAHIVCPFCYRHINITTGEEEESEDCLYSEAEFKYLLNSLSETVEDHCQFDCGIRRKIVELNEHENVCFKRGKKMSCMIKNCAWLGTNNGIIEHVEEMHPKQLIVLSNMEDEFIISVKEPSLVFLITEFERDYYINQLYWLQLYEENNSRYLVIIDHGTIGERSEPEQKFTDYSICSIRNDKYVITNSIAQMDEKLTGRSKNATHISCLEGDSYKVKILRNRAVPLLDSLKEYIECEICAEMLLAEIRQCPTGHSFCENCALKMKKCSHCKLSIGPTRNYVLERLVGDIHMACVYRNRGCRLNIKSGNLEKHVENCWYAEVPCMIQDCEWTGCYKNFDNHVVHTHIDKIRPNVTVFQFEIGEDNVRYSSLYRIGTNNFGYMRLYINHFYFMAYHITNQETTDFWFEVKFENPVKGHSISFCMPCRVATTDFFRNYSLVDDLDNCLNIDEDMCGYLRGDNQTFRLTIFRKS